MEVIIGEREYTEMLQLISGVLRNDGTSAEIVGRRIDEGLDRNMAPGMPVAFESDKSYAVRIVIIALLEASRGETIYPD